jgi:hypothetical protein
MTQERTPLRFPALATALLCSITSAMGDDKDTLNQAIDKVSATVSYAWKGETEFQSQIGNVPAQIPVLDGRYQKEVGLHIKSDRGEIFRRNDRVLIKQGPSDWQELSQSRPVSGASTQNRPRGALFSRVMIRNMKAPHEELKELAKALQEVNKGEKAERIGDLDCFQYSGELTDEAMKGSPLGRMLAQYGGAGAELKGSAKFWVDAQGNLSTYEAVAKATIEFQGTSVDFTLTRRTEITDVGKVKVEVPEGVRKLLSEKPQTEEKKE